MKTKKTTLISTETHETLSLRLNARERTGPTCVLCEECEAETPMLIPEDAALLVGLSVRAINRLVEEGSIHFKETPDGLLLVCLNNLERRTNQP